VESKPKRRQSHSQHLVTGFDPFGSLEKNPSAELLAQLLADDPSLWCEVLPTSYERAWKQLERLLKRGPRTLLMFGYSRNVDGLRLERYGRNEDNSTSSDNDRLVGKHVIIQGAPPKLAARADVLALDAQLRAAGAPVATSDHAGGYVCNHTYFRALDAAERLGLDLCLFVHVGNWRGSLEETSVIDGAKLLVEQFRRAARLGGLDDRAV
jgi:pyroglutamyl-peptidase